MLREGRSPERCLRYIEHMHVHDAFERRVCDRLAYSLFVVRVWWMDVGEWQSQEAGALCASDSDCHFAIMTISQSASTSSLLNWRREWKWKVKPWMIWGERERERRDYWTNWLFYIRINWCFEYQSTLFESTVQVAEYLILLVLFVQIQYCREKRALCMFLCLWSAEAGRAWAVLLRVHAHPSSFRPSGRAPAQTHHCWALRERDAQRQRVPAGRRPADSHSSNSAGVTRSYCGHLSSFCVHFPYSFEKCYSTPFSIGRDIFEFLNIEQLIGLVKYYVPLGEK